MDLVDRIAEQRISEAIERGELDGLPGMGRPLPPDDDPLVPAELRMAYRILKNAGFVPPEIELRREIHGLHELLACVDDGEEKVRISMRLRVLMMRLSALRPDTAPALDERYLCDIDARLTGTSRPRNQSSQPAPEIKQGEGKTCGKHRHPQ